MIDWSKISPEQFEQLCAELLQCNRFANIQWYGKGGGDKGRDIIAFRLSEPFPGSQFHEKWLIQCKRYAKRPLAKLDLERLFTSAKEHQPHTVLVAFTGTLTADVRDWVESIKQTYRFHIIIWEARDLENQISRHYKQLTNPPQLAPQRGKPTLFYYTETGRHYYCNEVEDVGFVVVNSFSIEKDFAKIHDFIQFIRENETVFHGEINDDDERKG